MLFPKLLPDIKPSNLLLVGYRSSSGSSVRFIFGILGLGVCLSVAKGGVSQRAYAEEALSHPINLALLSSFAEDGSGATPWVNPIRLSARYTSFIRGSSLEKHKRSEPRQDLNIFNRLDRYVLARTRVKDPLEHRDPELESLMSLSHNWRGSASGYLLNAKTLEDSPYWIKRRFRGYGTPEMLAAIKAGVHALRTRFPNAPPLIIGDLSKRYGGHFPPHLSHQSGRDADIGYFVRGYYSHRLKGLSRVSHHTIDAEKTWTFLSGMIKTGLVESMFIDYRLQKKLYHYAKTQKEWSQRELKRIFSYPLWKGKMISHLSGHSDHMHIRFYAPLSAQSAATYMKNHGQKGFRPLKSYTRPRRGETLIQLARRFRVSWRTLMRWNRLTPAQARRPLKKNRRLIVGYKTPYSLRSIKFPLPKDRQVFVSSTHLSAD